MKRNIENCFVVMLVLAALCAKFYGDLSASSHIDREFIIQGQDQSEPPIEERSEGEACDSEQNSFDNENFIGQLATSFFAAASTNAFIDSNRSLLHGVDRTPFSPPEVTLV